jgi:glycosyltransferase involved in cell wall biosynthesis
MFGRWAAAQIAKERWDVVHCWSGVAEEVLRAPLSGAPLRLIMRGSAHIRAQECLLREEAERTRTPSDCPSPWMIAREEREYALADRIVVLSSFAYESFVAAGIKCDKLQPIPLGVQTEAFRPTTEVVESRVRRILAGKRLRVLYVGALSFQKGMWDLAAMLRQLDRERLPFRLVGPTTAEVAELMPEIQNRAEYIHKQPQHELPESYAWGDLFIFPTIQDGFAAVLAQAHAGALPILTTTNCSGPDLIRDGETGWVLPIRSPDAFVERLRWCDAHREELAAMVRRIYDDFQPRDWSDMAADFEAFCREQLERKQEQYHAARS